MAIGTTGNFALDMDQLDIGVLTQGTVVVHTSSQYAVDLGGGEIVSFIGTGFAYDATGAPIGGTVTTLGETYFGAQVYTVSGFSVPATQFFSWALLDDTTSAKLAVFGGADTLSGNANGDVLRSYAGDDSVSGLDGNDTLDGGAGNDTLMGGNGNDLILDSQGQNYLRGEDGADSISGGSGFDDINGNVGNDTAHGNAGDDWVVGGKDNDMLFGDAGGDIVWGNLGNDTVDGGDGNDQVRGGQGDDSVSGGAGDDFVSGDRGNDTISGGAGADLFHGSQDAGIDRVLDFHASEGDRVMLDPGTTYTLSQVGADTVIDMGGGNQMILVGVQLSTLPSGWIFLG
jgi:Ca2+-binding RTX toxin-like protein